jgi:alpha-amylase/alpha-mannosidase (GH57 family)
LGLQRFICVHGHFYQPPRENAWLERVELQDSAHPYHDWNERISAECYAPNANSRILDDEKRITLIVNNYSRISFNFGPTLLSWLENGDPETYQAILEADRLSLERFSGHGSALAQVYSHPILPLCNARDRETQVRWGIRDFQHRFGRAAEGMWLPETAVDLDCLDVLAAHDIRFTVLAPHQASHVRRLDGGEWEERADSSIDPRMPYLCRLPSGRTIHLFFYDGPVSRAVAFERLLATGERFVDRLLGVFSADDGSDQLVHIATDGETYGHHHRFGDMALAYALHHIERNGLARITNYGEFLASHPPTHEVRVRERTSWSCAHGLQRWRDDCGCRVGTNQAWNQKWRAPLRDALDWLRDEMAPRYAERAGRLLRDPWAARDDYIDVILDRSAASVDRLFARHAVSGFGPEQRSEALKLLELQRHAMLMYTSCGWFFDELSGIETLQILQYACRAAELARELFGESLEDSFLQRLERAPSNLPEHLNGRKLYETKVRSSRVDMAKFGANYAATLLFEDGPIEEPKYGFRVDCPDPEIFATGRSRLTLGRMQVSSKITLERQDLTFGCALFGEHNLSCGVRPFAGDEAFRSMREEVTAAFSRADLPEVLRLLDHHFLQRRYSLQTLFRDEQRQILDRILESTLRDAESAYRRLYEEHAPLMRFLKSLETPLPRALSCAAELVLNSAVRQLLEAGDFDVRWLGGLLEEARAEGVGLDTVELAYTARGALEAKLEQVTTRPEDLEALKQLEGAAKLVRGMPFNVHLGKVENGYHRLLKNVYPDVRRRAEDGDESAQRWVELFRALGHTLRFAVD